MEEFKRNCPSCKIELIYKNKRDCKNAEKNNKICRKCAIKTRKDMSGKNSPRQGRSNYDFWLQKYGKEIADQKLLESKQKQSIASSGKNNPMYGKSPYDIWLQKYGKEEADKRLEEFKNKALNRYNTLVEKYGEDIAKEKENERREKISNSNCGEKNSMYGKSIYSVWIEKYGEEIANQKLEKLKEKHSINNSGENNPMYGKPAPIGSGNGFSGYYQNNYFRSLLELHYLIYLLDNNIKFENGELKKYHIPYIMDGIKRNYLPDYYLPETDQIIEIKPKKLINSYENKLKFEAAKQQLGNKHIILTEDEIVKIDLQILYNKYIKKEIIFDKGYDIKFEEYYNKNRKVE
jgi:hypothetical protein